MKYFLLAVIFCLPSITLIAQEKIDADRPSETQTPSIVPQGWPQAELGFTKENQEGNNYRLLHPNVLLRYGLSKKFELRVEDDIVSEHAQLIPNPKTTSGVMPVELGTKILITEERGIRPKTALLAQVGLPFLSSKAFRTPHLSPSFRLAMENSITKALTLGYNIGAEWDGESTVPSWLYTFAPSVELGEHLQAFVEIYGDITKGEMPEHNVDGGVAYLLSDNTQLDLSGGFGLSPESFKNFISIGFSFRIPVAKR